MTIDTDRTDRPQGLTRTRIPCAAPVPLTDADRRAVADRMGAPLDAAAAMFTKALGAGAFIVCPSCKGGDTYAPFPFSGCDKCTGRGYQWAIEGGDGAGGWAVVDWSDAGEYGGAVSGEPLQGAMRR